MRRLATMIRKEMMLTMRGNKAFWLLLLTLVACGTGYYLIWINEDMRQLDLNKRNEMARTIFTVLTFIELIAFALCAPMLAAGTVTIERERRTIDLLYCTGFRAIHILLGKWVSIVAFMILLIIAILPIQSMVFSLGGVGLDDYLLPALIIALTVLSYGMFGLAISARMRRSTTALVSAIGIIILWNIACPIVGVLSVSRIIRWTGSPGTMEATVEWLASAASPIWTMINVMTPRMMAGASLKIPFPWAFVVFHTALFLFFAWRAWRRLGQREEAPIAPRVVVRRVKPEPSAPSRNGVVRLFNFINHGLAWLSARNPVFQREILFGSMGRGRALTLMIILSALFSLTALFASDATPNDQCQILSLFVICFCVGLLPAWAATAITSEREEMTWPLLRATPLTERQIVLGKFAVYVKAALIVTISIVTVPLLYFLAPHEQSYSPNLNSAALRDPELIMAFLARALPTIIGYVLFFGAAMVYWSSRARTNASAITSAYITLFLLFVAPIWLVSSSFSNLFPGSDSNSWDQLSAQTKIIQIAGLLRHVMAPICSPFIYILDDENFFSMKAGALARLAHFAMLLILAALLLLLSERRLRTIEGEGRGA